MAKMEQDGDLVGLWGGKWKQVTVVEMRVVTMMIG